MPDALPPVVVMGVSACGKSTVGAELARRHGVPFVDADDLHPPANIAKMAAGTPLDERDREPWLDLVAARLAEGAASGGIVVACSALTRATRDRLRQGAPGTVFVHLTGSPEVIRARAVARTGHFMPPALLDSQLALLEPLAAHEAGVTVDVALDPHAVAARSDEALTEYLAR